MRGKVVIAGGSGYIGRHVAPRLASADFEVVILSRTPSASEVFWDGKTLGQWAEALEGAEAVVNLSGLSVGKHWSLENKLAIQESRLLSTRVIGEAVKSSKNPPKAWINASATGIYGDRADEELTEASAPGSKGDFLVDLCVAWEDEFFRAESSNTRKVCMRTGVVFGKHSLAFQPMYKAAKFFVGGHLGSGKQFMSWIHIEDLVRMYCWTIESDVAGLVNAVSTEPVRNESLMHMFRSIMRRPWAPPLPAFMLKLVTFFGGPEASLILESERVIPHVALNRGFEFEYPRLREALVDLILPRG